MSTSRFRPPPPPPDRRESLPSRGIDRSRDRSREIGRGYSPDPRSRDRERSKERVRGWSDVSRKREQERRKPKSPQRDSVAFSREGDKDSTQTSSRRIFNTAIPIPTEPAARRSPLRRKFAASTVDVNAAPTSAPKLINIDADSNLPPRPPSVTPSPITPLRSSDTVKPLSSSSFSTSSQQHSRKHHDTPLVSASGDFVVPPLLSPAPGVIPSISSVVTTATATIPFTTSSVQLSSMTSQEGVGLSIRHGLDENQAPVIKETPVLLNSSSPTPNMGNSVSIATNMLSSNPTSSVGPGATLAGTPTIVTPTTTTTNNVTQPEVAEIEMAPLDQTTGAHRSTTDEVSSLVWSTLSAAIQPPTEAVSQKQQEQSEDVSQSSLLPSPPPSLPPLPSFELTQTTSGLSQEAKLDLWNKRIKYAYFLSPLVMM